MRTRYWHSILTKEYLLEQYVNNKLSPYKISKLIQCDSKTVWDYLLKHKIPLRETKNLGALHGCWKGCGEIPLTYWNNLKTGAKNRNIIFDIQIQDIWELFQKQNGQCALSGRIIGFEFYKSNTASLDRIDSQQGYILSNVQWLHRDINYAKQSLNNIEFISMCEEIIHYQTQKEQYEIN